MELNKIFKKTKVAVGKYKYALIILVIGLALLLIPTNKTQTVQRDTSVNIETGAQHLETQQLSEILESIQGAGKVKVLLSTASGEKTVYQTDSDTETSGDGGSVKTETVILTNSERSEYGLVSQINPPTYLGAIVVCQGADSPTVKLAITQAVAKITGLGTEAICVLKMK